MATESTRHFTLGEAQDAARKLGITPPSMENLRMGMDVELEHGTIAGPNNVTSDDPVSTAKIALAHLNERGDYYQRLAELEDAPLNVSMYSLGAFVLAHRLAIIIIIVIIVLIAIVAYRAHPNGIRAELRSRERSDVHSEPVSMSSRA
jgi:hypothetical protein